MNLEGARKNLEILEIEDVKVINVVARMPEPITVLKQWVKGLGKDVSMRPPPGDEEVPAPKKVKEKKRKDASSSPVSKKKTSAKKSRKPRGAPRLKQIGGLNSQVDELLAEAEKLKENMDVLASKKKVVQEQLELAETQLRAAEENASVQIDKIKELRHRLDLATSDKAQREALEEVSAQGFDIAAEIENAKAEETRARRLAFPEEDSESSSESENGENSKDAASNEDQAT
ncbi:uncharacterized protein [Nicotiana tomentosiformis]|uniref:uncharacterized protein n=1 Tax=Nicotiana tomentosiformis TaxID=4098 RepID=UPI00388CA5DC